MNSVFSLRRFAVLTFLGLFVSAAAAQPVITNQPAATNLSVGGTATFSVGATGAPLRYQWRLNGTSLPNATNASFTVANVTITNGGSYEVAVFNPAGAVNSAVAGLRLTNLTVLPFNNTFPGGTNNSSNLVGRGNNFGATKQGNEPAHARNPGGKSVWLTWESQGNGLVTFKTTGSGFDTLLAAYTGNAVNALTEVEYDDDTAGFLNDIMSFNVQDGVTYRIAVDGFSGAEGDIILSWNFIANASQPVITTHPQSLTVDTNASAQFSVAPAPNGTTFQWFFDGQPIQGATDFTLVINSATLANVGDYSVRVSDSGRSRDSHHARLQINHPGPGTPVQDVRSTEKIGASFAASQGGGFPFNGVNAVAHGYSGTQLFSTTTSTKDIGEPNHAGVVGGASEWFAFQADTNGTLYLNTDGSNFDTVLAVYIGPAGSYVTLTNVASDNNSGSNGLTSKVSLPATLGTIYWIAVDGNNTNTPSYGPSRGSVVLNYRLVAPLTITNVVETTNSNGRIIFKVNSTPNLLTKVQASTNLSFTNWTSLLTNTPVSGSFSFTNTNIFTLPQRFYRAINQF